MNSYSLNKIFLSLFFVLISFTLSKKINFYIPPKNAQSCAIFECQPEQDKCAVSKIAGDKISVTLSDICDKNYYCDIGGNPYEILYEGEEVEGTCKPIKIGKEERYPGEDCVESSNCKSTSNFSSECVEGKCTGKKDDQLCSSSEECLKGLFCDKNTKRCKAQKVEWDTCTSSFECQNNLLCYNGICKNVLFSVKIGENITDLGDGVDPKYYCEYGMALNNTCVAFGFDTPEFNKQRYIPCNYGDACFYNYYPLKYGSFELPCQCGYNEEGKGYCPIPHSANDEAWRKLMIIQRFKIDNDCHSLNRFNCYIWDYNFHNLEQYAIDELNEGNVYYKSVDCAKKVFQGYEDQFTFN